MVTTRGAIEEEVTITTIIMDVEVVEVAVASIVVIVAIQATVIGAVVVAALTATVIAAIVAEAEAAGSVAATSVPAIREVDTYSTLTFFQDLLRERETP